MIDKKELALTGGTPLRFNKNWPIWPSKPCSETLPSDLEELLESGRWSSRARYAGRRPIDWYFGKEFAESHDSLFGVTTPNGTSALALSLEALGIGAGDEVLIPGLTWIATAIAVLKVNAVPVFVDVDPNTYCMSVADLAKKINPKSKCVVVVHWHCNVAAMDEISRLCKDNNCLLVEDCAQAHGGEFKGKKVGSWGAAAAFSLHNDKLVTCGEGGIATTSNPSVYERMQSCRLDGFNYSSAPLLDIEGVYEQNGPSSVMGTSNCISEFQALIARHELSLLDSRTKKREHNASLLAQHLNKLPGVKAISETEGTTIRPYYEFVFFVNFDEFCNIGVETMCWALAAELGFSFYPEDEALDEHEMYQPSSNRSYYFNEHQLSFLRSKAKSIPVSRAAHKNLIMFLHPPLLGSEADMLAISSAVEKIQNSAKELREFEKTHGDNFENEARRVVGELMEIN